MDIFLYSYNKGEFIKFPIVPLEVSTTADLNTESFNTIQLGEVTLLGLPSLRTISLSSFFPAKEYNFNKDNSYKGMEYVDKINQWRFSKKPLYIIISDLNINYECVIESFEYGIKDGSGDIYYSMEIKEYRRPAIRSTTPVQPKQSKPIIQTAPVKKPTPLNSQFGIVIADGGLNVRSGKSTKHPILGGLAKGAKVKLFRLEQDWWHIYYGNHGGYCFAKYIKPI